MLPPVRSALAGDLAGRSVGHRGDGHPAILQRLTQHHAPPGVGVDLEGSPDRTLDALSLRRSRVAEGMQPGIGAQCLQGFFHSQRAVLQGDGGDLGMGQQPGRGGQSVAGNLRRLGTPAQHGGDVRAEGGACPAMFGRVRDEYRNWFSIAAGPQARVVVENRNLARRSQSTWAPEPQKPSTPWVADIRTSTRSAERLPIHATSVASSRSSGPRLGCPMASRCAPADLATSRNFVLASWSSCPKLSTYGSSSAVKRGPMMAISHRRCATLQATPALDRMVALAGTSSSAGCPPDHTPRARVESADLFRNSAK